jgi:predicted RNase H-like nuclease (RuvC/YqgF family)
MFFLLQILKEKYKPYMPVAEIRQQLPEVSVPYCENRHFESEGLRSNELTKLKEGLKKCDRKTQDLQIKLMEKETESSHLRSKLKKVSKFFHTIPILNFQI